MIRSEHLARTNLSYERILRPTGTEKEIIKEYLERMGTVGLLEPQDWHCSGRRVGNSEYLALFSSNSAYLLIG